MVEDRFEIDIAGTYFSWILCCFIKILYVPEWETSRMLFEKCNRILIGLGGPGKIELHLHEVFVCVGENIIERSVAFHFIKFGGVVMIRKLNSILFTCFTRLTKNF